MASLNAEALRNLLDYDQETGVFTWRKREEALFADTKTRTAAHACANWNSKYAGSIAGTALLNKKSRRRRIWIGDKAYYEHRLAWLWMTGEWPKRKIDHRDGTDSNNKLDNLRDATQAQNRRNSVKYINNRSGLKGVSWNKAARKWVAQITMDYKNKYLGVFDCPAAAHLAYVVAADNLHGEFARFS